MAPSPREAVGLQQVATLHDVTKTIWASLLGFDLDLTKEFLDAQGMAFDEGLSMESRFAIEIRDSPSIIRRVEKRYGEQTWSIMTMTKDGVSLYFAHEEAGDGYVFLPMNNILCIHTLTEEDMKMIPKGHKN